jgi:hypothetical protein
MYHAYDLNNKMETISATKLSNISTQNITGI